MGSYGVQEYTVLLYNVIGKFFYPGSLHYDAAILVLSENLRLAKNIYPICLPRAGETLDAFYNGAGECIVTGWGKQVLQGMWNFLHSIEIPWGNAPSILRQYFMDLI